MSQPTRPPLIALVAAAVGGLGVALIARRRARPTPDSAPPAPVAAAPDAPASPPPTDAPAALPRPVVTTQVYPTLGVALAGLAGLMALVAGQLALLSSRHPLPPLLAFGLGVALLWPVYTFYERRWLAEPPPPPAPLPTPAPPLPNQSVYVVGGLFFATATLLLAQTRVLSPPLVFCWLMSVAVVTRAALGGGFALPPARIWALRPSLTRFEAAALAGLMALVVVFHSLTPPAPGSSALVGAALAAAVVPLTYALGRRWWGVPAGLMAAGLAAVSGWLLALSRADGLVTGLALAGGIYLLALDHARLRRQRTAFVLAGLALGAGVLVAPAFLAAAWLLPLTLALAWLDDRRGLRRLVGLGLLALLVALVVMLPAVEMADVTAGLRSLGDRAGNQWTIWTARLRGEQPPARLLVSPRANPQLDPLEAWANALLLFNLTSDPNPLHGIANRPVLSPGAAGAFAAGLLGLAWGVYARRRWGALFPLLAWALLTLPAAGHRALPIRYPDLQLAAGALPLVMLIAAGGLWLPLHLLIMRLGRAGALLALALVGLLLALTLLDARAHFLP